MPARGLLRSRKRRILPIHREPTLYSAVHTKISAIRMDTLNPVRPVQRDSSQTEKLPVVELQPFVKEVWSRCKSLPDSYKEVDQVRERSGKNLNYSAMGYPNPERTYTARENPSSRVQTASDKQEKLAELQTVRAPENKHFSNPPQGFATIGDREKTTLGEIKTGESPNVRFSLLRRARTEEDFIHDQNMRVSGQKMDELPIRNRSFYLEPWQYYLLRRSQSDKPHYAPEQVLMSMGQVEGTSKDKQIYDAFERNKTLPSINVSNAPMKRRRRFGDGSTRPLSGRRSGKISYRLGVPNSLDYMCKSGRPLGIERQLTFQLRNTLGALRRSKVAPGETFACGKAVPKYLGAPTIGEALITVGLYANSKKKNNSPASPEIAAPSRATTSFKSEFRDSGIESHQHEHLDEKSLTRDLSSQLMKVSLAHDLDLNHVTEDICVESHEENEKTGESTRDLGQFQRSSSVENIISKVQESNTMSFSSESHTSDISKHKVNLSDIGTENDAGGKVDDVR